MKLPLAYAIMGTIAFGMFGCDGDPLTEVIVEFSADESVASRAFELRISVWSVDDDVQVYPTTPFRLKGEGSDVTFPVRLPMTPKGGDAGRTYRVEGALYDSEGAATPFATIRAISSYVEGRQRVLRLRFHGECADVECADGLTCWEGKCLGACFAFSSAGESEGGPVCDACETCVSGACEARDEGSVCTEDGHVCEQGECTDSLPFPQCALRPDADTLALYRMDRDDVTAKVLRDETLANRDGAILGDAPATTMGPEGCGDALVTMADQYGSIADDADDVAGSDWALASGSVDLLVRLDTLPTEDAGDGGPHPGWAILSRDKAGDVDGHFTLFVHPEGNFYVRYQKMLSATTSLEYLICTTPFPPDEWHHLAINFGEGPLELFVDGRRAPFEGQLAGLPRLCGDGNPEYGIDGAPGVPWTLGADASCLGCPEPVNQYLRGAIDELRISKVRRDFDL